MWIDSHAHLDSPEILVDLGPILQRASSAGVEGVLTVGCVGHGDEDIPAVVTNLIEDHPGVYASLGVHPHDADRYRTILEQQILQAMNHPKVVAWGEIGLDYFYDNSPRKRQKEVFRRQIRLARSAGVPIIVHTRDADDDTGALLGEEYADCDGPTGVLHCFSGSRRLAQIGLELGFYLGFGGMLTFPKADNVRRAAIQTPLDRLLVETDSPYLAPVPHRGKRNEPAYAALAGEKLAELHGISVGEMARITSENFRRLFGVGPEALTQW